MRIRMWVTMFAIALYCLTVTTCYAGVNEVRVMYGPGEIKSDADARIVDGRTMIPLRALFEALGYTVEWDSVESKGICSKGDVKITVLLNSNSISVERAGEVTDVQLDVPVMQIQNRVFVPLKALSEVSGESVEWYGDSRTVCVGTKAHENYVKVSPKGVIRVGETKELSDLYTGESFKFFSYTRFRDEGPIKTITKVNASQYPLYIGTSSCDEVYYKSDTHFSIETPSKVSAIYLATGNTITTTFMDASDWSPIGEKTIVYPNISDKYKKGDQFFAAEYLIIVPYEGTDAKIMDNPFKGLTVKSAVAKFSDPARWVSTPIASLLKPGETLPLRSVFKDAQSKMLWDKQWGPAYETVTRIEPTQIGYKKEGQYIVVNGNVNSLLFIVGSKIYTIEGYAMYDTKTKTTKFKIKSSMGSRNVDITPSTLDRADFVGAYDSCDKNKNLRIWANTYKK